MLSNRKLAAALYAKGCKLEDGWSYNNLGVDYKGYHSESNRYTPKDYDKGLELLTLACETYGKGHSCDRLSRAYYDGDGVKKGLAESLSYSIKACEFGDDHSCE